MLSLRRRQVADRCATGSSSVSRGHGLRHGLNRDGAARATHVARRALWAGAFVIVNPDVFLLPRVP